MNKLFTPAVRIAFAFIGLAIILGTVVSTFNYERSAQAAYNAEINYQGKLTNGSNVAVANGTYNMEFKLYDAVSGGSLLWTETRTGGNKVQVTNGVFSVMLGEVNAFGSLDFNQTLFLSVNIGGTGSPSWDGEMTPRKKIGTVPVAFLASNLKGTGLVDITNTATQATFNYDGSNRATLGVASNGFTTLTSVGGGAGWNLTGGNVGIGTATTSAKLHVTATTEQLRIGYDAGNYASFTTSSGGDLTIAPSGSDLAITGNVDVSGTLTAGTADAFSVNASGQVTAGTWQGGVIGGTYGGTGVNNGSNTITLGGNISTAAAFTTAGANALTLTTTGPTNVTLPTSGTLITSGVTTLSSLVSIGTITTGVWNGTAITDTYVADTLTVDSSSSVHWNALNNYPAACSAGSAISALADTTNTCTSFNTDTSITLQDAYGATSGNTIATTDARNLAVTLAEVTTPTSFTVENQDTAATSAQRIFNSIASGTATNGLLIEQTGAGTMTNGLQIAETAGTITDGILITGTLGNILNSGTIDITGGGAITGATGVTSSGTITFSGLGGGGTQCVNVNNTGVLGVTTCGGALTPWTSDIDADGFDLRDLSNLEFRDTAGAPAGSVVAMYSDNTGDLNINSLTGKTTNIQVNGTDEYNFSSTGLAFNSNNITGLGTGITATAGLTITSTSANLAFATATSGNITFAPASTGSVQITSGVTSGTTTSAGLSFVANSLSSGTGVDISSTSLTSGSLLNLLSNGTAAAASQTGLNISLQGTNGTGGITSYGAQIANSHAGATSTNVALQLSATNGTTANYALLTNGGNVGIGDTSPASLFTVGSGDLFQINTTGEIGAQVGPTSDYLFSLAGTATNDHSRILNITQADNANEDTTAISIVNTIAPAALWSTQMYVKNISATMSPTVSITGSASPVNFYVYGNEQVINSSAVTMSTSAADAYTYHALGNSAVVNFDPIVNDVSGANTKTANGYGTYSLVAGAPTLTAIGGTTTFNSYGLFGQNTTSSAGNASLTYNSYGIYGEASGNLTATGTTTHYGAYLAATGTAGNNYGLYATASGGTNNYAAIFAAGNVGIGTTAPTSLLQVQQAADSTNTTTPIALDINSVGASGELTASSGSQTFARIAPVINQSSSASYRALDINVTETATTTSGLNRLADFRVDGSSKLAISNNGSITLQNASNLVTPYGGIGDFQNHLVRSEEFDNASWVKTNVTAPTANTQVGPEGSTSAESLATSSSGGDVCQWSGTAAASDTFTFSVWARSTSGTQNFDLRVDAGATSCATANNVTGTAVTHTATTSWQRFTVTQTFSSATGNVKARIFPGGTGGSGTIYAWAAQLDKSTRPSNYVLTTSGALTNTNRGQVLESNFATASGFTYGGRHVTSLTGAISASSTTVGQLIRVIDNASGTDDTATVRGLEVQSYSGSNINGVNTAVAAFGYTFGVHAVTTGQANESAQPAAVFADLDNGSAATFGNAIRAYTNDATSADLVSFYQESSAFTGNGLVMNFGNSSGSFSGNFLNLKTAGTTKAHIDSNGYVFASLTSSGTAALCWDGTGGTDERIQDCSGAPVADYAEMYPVVEDAEVGDIMVLGNKLVNTYDINDRGAIDWGKVKGQINQLVKSTGGYQNTVIGVVSDNYGDFSSTGYNLKEEDNPTAIALNGRIPVKVTDENGAIKAGDYITTSNTLSGYGMKATRSGQVIGQALADFNFDDSSTGQVMIFVKVGYQSIGNTIVLDAPSINGTNLQSGNNNSLTNTASTFVIQQQTSGDEDAEANILQLQTGDANRFMVSSSGATSILSNLNCEADADSCPSVLKVTQADTELMNIDARGTLTLAGTIVIKDDTFAGSIATDEDGLAEITFSYHLGTGKPVVQLTAEAQIPVFAQIVEFKQDDKGNYTGFVMKTFDLISGPIQAIVHYNVVGKQAGYITLGEAVVPDEELQFYSEGGDSGDGVGLVIDGGEVVGTENDQNEGNSSGDNSGDNGSVSGDFTSNNPNDNITTDDGSGSEPVSE